LHCNSLALMHNHHLQSAGQMVAYCSLAWVERQSDKPPFSDVHSYLKQEPAIFALCYI